MKKFKIPSVPPTTNKCIRFPNNIIEDVEKAIRNTNCTFTAFVVEAVRIALENLKEEKRHSENVGDFNYILQMKRAAMQKKKNTEDK